ncbi:FAD-binding domain-containing protein [Cadophora sp. DSE1049]|nr:FAD-binding domain-containing protein [Cadophora sp. DSE1049]
MKPFALLHLLIHLPFILGTATPPNCRKLPTDTDWPSPSAWSSAIPGIIPNTPLTTNTTTNSSSIPTYRIRARTFLDVQNAIRFATTHNIRLSVITTGHDQLGRSDAGSGLLIDLSLLKGVRVLESFEPTLEGAESPDHSGTAGPNVIVPKEGSGLFTMSGASATVAVAGGWGQNGGYGPLTAQYGLGVDQWLEAKIVLPSGELVIANAISNPELFWAIRGGGGGTFGVVVEATWKAYPNVPITGFNWYINSTVTSLNTTMIAETGETPVSEAMQYLFGEMEGLKSRGISAYFYVHASYIRCFAVHPGNNSGLENVEKVWEPILNKMSSFPDMTPFQTKMPVEYETYREFFDGTYGPLTTSASNGSANASSVTVSEPYNRGIVPFDSNLLSAAHLRSPNITYALRTTGGDYGVLMCAPGDRVGDGSDVSANPGWRKAVVLVVGMKDEARGVSVDGLRELAPEMGAYINEGSTTSKNWTSSFWGTNYPRLSTLKSSLDPNMTFWISPGINAHYMEAMDGRACLVDPQPEVPSLIPPKMERSVTADLRRDGGFLFGRQELDGTTFPEIGVGEGIWWA